MAERRTTRILVLSASARAESLNTRLATLAARELERAGATVELATIADFAVPTYDGDLESSDGIPAGADALRARLEGCDGFLIASPEYNAAMPGSLKNLIDWTSRFRPQPFNARHAMLISASPSMVGGNRGLWSLRVPLEHLGARVYPDMFSLAQAHDGLSDENTLVNEGLGERFAVTVSAWLDQVEASTHYACAKARWFEFLGEQPAAVIDRVQ